MIPDAEPIVVAWAKSVAAITDLVGGSGAAARIATRLPKNWTPTALRMFAIPAGEGLVAEGPDAATSIIQIDAFAKSTGESPDYATASLLARTVHAEAWAASDVHIVGRGMLIDFGSITVPRRVEEPDAKWARFTFEATAAVRSIE